MRLDDMRLYDMKMAPNPRRVRMFLAEKGLAVPLVEVDIQAGANLSPEYLAVNPRGVVPTLVLADGRVLDESIAICRYVEALRPEPNLFGRDAFEIGEIEQWQRRMEFDGMFNIAAAFRNSAPAYASRGAPGSGPETPAIPALAERGQLLGRQWLDRLEEALATREWLAAGRFTVADITAFICLDFAKWVGLRAGPDHPNVTAYHARIKARPSAAA
ncbi:glutathione S-transferase family protein [Sandaracinobacteroides sp. A072]|uniref:glutathione S-transferase family protein n=1 Tax=Sandaracinobacteroides sp. A072 TaxID=3461146 RepID=UPI0040415911